MTCETFNCHRPATRLLAWRRADGRTDSARYCDACALPLWQAGDDCEPSFPLAPVVSLRRAAT